MKTRFLAAVLLFLGATSASAQEPEPSDAAIRSTLVHASAGDLILVQEVRVDAPVSEVWAAYTTEAGWTSWASPVAEIDLRVGGTIRTHYEASASIGDPGTNTLHILSYVPERLLTLQAELSESWPSIMQEDAERLMNVIVFQAVGDQQTQILSYGVGYRDVEAYTELMDFFIPANEGLFEVLKGYLERQ